MGWIKIENKLPHCDGNYIVYNKGEYHLAYYSERPYDDSNWHDSGFSIYPSHWMKLPLPPKNEKENTRRRTKRSRPKEKRTH